MGCMLMKDKIIEKLSNESKGLSLIEINDLLNLTSVEDYKELQKNMDALVTEGIVHKSKKDKFILMEKCSSLLTGIIHINKHGNGFVDTKFDEDTFVKRENLNGAVDGDFVEIDVQNDEGIVVNILKRDINLLVGEMVKTKNGNLEFALDDKKKKIKVKLTKETSSHLVEGHKVLVKIQKELASNLYLADVIKVLGHKNDPGVDILSIACKHEISLDVSDEVKNQVANMVTSVSEKELVGRTDLRNEVIFTIDGDDTKDIDDAVSIKKEDGYYILGVHIADVTNYVKEGSPLFESAYEKGTSSYLADTVLPMLPHELSNGICSLNEGVDRLTISCVMKIDTRGKIVDHDIFPSVINSKKKMTYKNVNKIIMENIDGLLCGKEEAHDAMAQGSMLAGLAFSNTRTTACHSISYPLTMKYHIPHGVAVSMLLAPVMRLNQPYIKNRKELFGAFGVENVSELSEKVTAILEKSGSPAKLSQWGANESDFEELVAHSMTKGRADNNPAELTAVNVEQILRSVF